MLKAGQGFRPRAFKDANADVSDDLQDYEVNVYRRVLLVRNMKEKDSVLGSCG